MRTDSPLDDPDALPDDFTRWLATLDDSALDAQTLALGAALVDEFDAGRGAKLRACLRKGAWSTKYFARQLLLDDDLPASLRHALAHLAYRAFTVRGGA
jgi:hypothetical protein